MCCLYRSIDCGCTSHDDQPQAGPLNFKNLRKRDVDEGANKGDDSVEDAKDNNVRRRRSSKARFRKNISKTAVMPVSVSDISKMTPAAMEEESLVD